MPRIKRGHANEEEASEETSQKRRKYNKSSLSIIEDMETTMDELKDKLPQEYAIGSIIYRIPRTLLKPATSAEKVLTNLEQFKDCLQFSAELEGLMAGANSMFLLSLCYRVNSDQVSESMKLKLVACIHGLAELISLADGTHTLLSLDTPMS
jgi:hypothetical protein